MDARKVAMNVMIKALKDKISKEVEGKFFNIEAVSDCKVRVGDNTFHVSKYLLAKASPVFEKMFISDFKEAQNGFVEMQGDADAVEALLKYIYMRKKVKGYELAREVIHLAHLYEIEELMEQCELVLIENITIDNADETYGLAKRLGLKLLQLKCSSVIFMDLQVPGLIVPVIPKPVAVVAKPAPIVAPPNPVVAIPRTIAANATDDEGKLFFIIPNVVDFRYSDTSVHRVRRNIPSKKKFQYRFLSTCMTFSSDAPNGVHLEGGYQVDECKEPFILTLRKRPGSRNGVLYADLWSYTAMKYIEEREISVNF